MLKSLLGWFMVLFAAAIGLFALFIAWWILVILALGLALTLWIRRLLGKPPLFQAVFRRDVRFGGRPADVGSGGVEPPVKGAVVIEGEVVVEDERGSPARPRIEGEGGAKER